MSRTNNVTSLIAALCAAILAATACINTDKTLGADFVPTNQDITIKTVEFDLPVGQRLSDSLQTTVGNEITVGSIYTEKFGTYNIGTALTISPASDSIVWGGDPKFVDLSVEMIRTGSQTLDDDQRYIPQNIYVNQLTVELDSSHVYSNSLKDSDINGPSVCQGSYVYTGGDTLVVHFTKEFGEKFFKIGREALDSTALFCSQMYGLYFSTDPADPQVGSGRITTFDVSSTYLCLTYSSIPDGSLRRRDTTVYFGLGNHSALRRIDGGKKEFEKEDAKESIIYEGLTGVKPYINGVKLKKIINDWMSANGIEKENLIVAKASLEFPFEYSGNPEQFDNYPDNLYLVTRVRGSVYTVYSPIAERYSASYDDGSINRSLFYFRPDAALLMQEFIRKDTEDISDQDDIWIIPTVTITTSSDNSSSYYNPYSYYDPYGYGYGGYGYGYGGYSPYGYGYGGYSPYGYGYGGYSPYGYGYGYGDYYGYGYGYGYGSSSSSSGSTYYYTDTANYKICTLNGTGAERHPKLKLTYTVLK